MDYTEIDSQNEGKAKVKVLNEPVKYLLPALIRHYAKTMSTKFDDIGTEDEIVNAINKEAEQLAIISLRPNM